MVISHSFVSSDIQTSITLCITVCSNKNSDTNQITDTSTVDTAVYMQVTQFHAHHQHAQQWSNQERLSQYPAPVLAAYVGRYSATSGTGRISKI